ncbi:MAG: TIGR02302 family protein [Methylocella sp.]
MPIALPEIGLLRLGRSSTPSGQNSSREPRDAALQPAETARNPRLERLISQARAVLLFERMWRLLAPALVVIGFFLCVSWTGLWLEAPHWTRILGVGALALGLIYSLLPLRRFSLPTRADALARIDRVSGLRQRPAAVLEDRLGNPGDDPATRALWNLHRRRAEQSIALLRAGAPSPRLVDLDRYAFRAIVLVGLVATAFIAGPEKYARVAAAFDWPFAGLGRQEQRVDAWIDPPAYTGRAPIVLGLHGANSGAPQKIEAPTGSIVIIRTSGGKASFEAEGALEDAAKEKPDGSAAAANKPAAPKTDSDNETRLVLRGNAKLTVGSLGAFEIAATPDTPPMIALTDAPKANARGTLALRYKITDDYGATSAEATFANPATASGRPAKRPLVHAPHAPLLLPPPGDLSGEAETTIDLSDHPWAGARVEMTLIARDDGGNAGKSESLVVTLPQKPFIKPLARALVEQRRNLVLEPDNKGRVATALEALMIAPDAFGVSAGVYLGLKAASERLSSAAKDSDLVEVADYLWAMALRIENGDLSETERDLRAAQQKLREALQRNAPPDEIKKLSDDLRAVMDKFLREFAEKQQENMGQSDPGAEKGNSRSVSPKDLQAMLDKMQDMARSGDTTDAQKMLDQLQNILENLKMARPRKVDPRAREMAHAINELGQMSQEQQDLRDETHQSADAGKRQQRGQMGQQEDPSLGDSPDDEDQDQDQDSRAGDASPKGQDQANQANLQKRQQALRDRLDKLQKRLDQAGQGEPGLDDAKKAMGEAEKALEQGSRGNDQAVDAQGRAIDAMREGAQKLAESMQGKGQGEPSDQEGEGEGQGEGDGGQGAKGQFGEGGADPLGRPTGGDRGFNPSARYDPLGVPAAQRAQRVLEELRRRLGEPSRSRDEIDYLERLLRRY